MSRASFMQLAYPVRDGQPSDIAVAVTLTGQREPADERFVMGSAVP